MPGAKWKEHEVHDLTREFIKTEAERQVFQNETALLSVLERLATVDGRLREEIEKYYFRIHRNSLLAGKDLEALGRLTQVLNVISGRAAIREDDE